MNKGFVTSVRGSVVNARYEDLKDIISILCIEELSGEDRNIIVSRARWLEKFIIQQ